MTKNTTTLDFLPVRISALFTMLEALRHTPATAETTISSGKLLLKEERKQIFWGDASLNLTLTEFWILACLVKYPGHVKSHDQLMEAANVVVTNNAIAAH